jgi:outer membrane protein assembly factor BamE (lipoprotein component of BamABCDE complex)
MKKILLNILLLILITNCTLNKVSNTHGVKLLENKSKKIVIGKSNANDILILLGPPSVKSTFDDNIWFYIERKKTSKSIFLLGAKKTIKNNVLAIKINNRGLLSEKKLLTLDNMENIEFDKSNTEISYDKNSYLFNLLTSLREKINSPTRKKVKE